LIFIIFREQSKALSLQIFVIVLLEQSAKINTSTWSNLVHKQISVLT